MPLLETGNVSGPVASRPLATTLFRLAPARDCGRQILHPYLPGTFSELMLDKYDIFFKNKHEYQGVILQVPFMSYIGDTKV